MKSNRGLAFSLGTSFSSRGVSAVTHTNRFRQLLADNLTDESVAKMQAELLTPKRVDSGSKETRLAKGIADVLGLSELETAAVLGIKSGLPDVFGTLKRGVAVSKDVEERVLLLFEIVATVGTILNRPANDAEIKKYLERGGYLSRMKQGTFEALLDVRRQLSDITGGVWGRKHADTGIEEKASTD